jgi:hypothetical protein
MHDLGIGCIVQEANRGPSLVETPDGEASLENPLELVLADVVVPDVPGGFFVGSGLALITRDEDSSRRYLLSD